MHCGRARGRAGLAQAQQAIKLTIIDGYPPKALWVKVLIDYFIPEVNKRLAADGNKYKIDWQQAFSGQIAKPRGVMDAIKNKLGDIGVVTTVFHSSKLPLNNLPYYTPFVSRNPILVGKVMDDLTDKFPAFQKQFDDQNQILLTSYSSIDNYGIFTKNADQEHGRPQGPQAQRGRPERALRQAARRASACSAACSPTPTRSRPA